MDETRKNPAEAEKWEAPKTGGEATTSDATASDTEIEQPKRFGDLANILSSAWQELNNNGNGHEKKLVELIAEKMGCEGEDAVVQADELVRKLFDDATEEGIQTFLFMSLNEWEQSDHVIEEIHASSNVEFPWLAGLRRKLREIKPRIIETEEK